MLCMRSMNENGEDEQDGSVPVFLNVYDLTSTNGYAYWLGLGVYHSGVQVHDVEYAFGAHEHPTTGIFEGEPRQCDGFTFRKTLMVGKTEMSTSQVRALMEDLASEYMGNAYNLITKNCNHFCNDACVRLTGNPIPSWINRLAKIGLLCICVLPMSLSSTKVLRRQGIKDKVCEGEKEKLRSNNSNRFTSPSDSSSCMSSPPSSTRRGRSRSSRRHVLTPSSPSPHNTLTTPSSPLIHDTITPSSPLILKYSPNGIDSYI